jgi:cytochrome P450
VAPGTPIVVERLDDALQVLRGAAFVQILPESGHGAEYTVALTHGAVLHLDGDAHFERRRLLALLFRRNLLLEYEHTVLVPSLARISRDIGSTVAVDRDAPSDGAHAGELRLDLLQLCREVFVDLFSRVVGFEDLETREARADFLADFNEYELGFRAKYAADPETAVARALVAKDRILARHFDPAWEHRARMVESGGDDGEMPDDLMGLLLRNREHYAQWGDDASWREAMLFMVASIGSTGNALCHAVADLLDWSGDDPDRIAQLDDPAFLSRAFRDSVRLHQTNHLLRTAVADAVLPSGVVVPAGAIVAVDRAAVNRELEARSDAPELRFAPDRTLEDGLRDHGLSFGDGPHSCIGRTMVLGDRGTRRDGQEEDGLEGLAVATLVELFRAGVRRIPDDPPTLVGDMAREMWDRFPVVMGGRARRDAEAA